MRVLVVEDHCDTRRVVDLLVNRCGCRTALARNFKEAVKLLSDTNFDVMIADLNLPDGDGVDLLGEAKLLQPPLKAIAITGRAADTDRARGIAAGFHFYLTKPVDFLLLREALESLRRKPQQN